MFKVPELRSVLTLAALAMLCGLPAQAKERWFTIELLIFKNGGNAWQQEDWDPNPELYYPQPLLVSTALSLSSESDTPTKELEFDGKLADAAEKLTASGQYRVLYSRRWQQGLLQTKDAPYLLITGGRTYGAHYELEGSIKFSVERYLHASANLWFTTFGEPTERRDSSDSEYAAVSDDWRGAGTLTEEDEWDSFDEDFEEPMTLPSPPWNSDYIGPQEPVRRVVTLRQQRRMRSKETHYIDHPSIGVLIRIEPVPDDQAIDGED